MSRRGMSPTTPLSAALTIVQWTHEHSREPRCHDACGSGGLYWYTTYYKCFNQSNFSAIVSMAFALVHESVEPLPCASHISSSPARTMKRCLNAPECQEWIVDEGAHIRFCAACRWKRNSEMQDMNIEYIERMLSPHMLDRYGIGRDGWLESLIDWSGE